MQPKTYSISDHDIAPHLIDSDALFVLHQLQNAGFIAYLVGGGVRDLLLKRTPKDFDISTSALPAQIKKIFGKRCLLIGRRFLLAHLHFNHKIIEVSTFRSGENDSDLIVQDNQWGTPEQDVLRRDFTINGLFYDPVEHTVIDYVGGWEDIHAHTLRVIGNPEMRFKQDPVRMIRLLKFRARFGFKIEPSAKRALLDCREEILKSSTARVMEELLRMLESGASAPFINLMLESGLLPLIYPSLAQFLRLPEGKEVMLYLTCVDKLAASEARKTLSRPLLVTCLVFPFLQRLLKTHYLDKDLQPHLGEIILTASEAIREFHHEAFVRFPKRLIAILEIILVFQYRFTPTTGKPSHSLKIFRSREFSQALNFLKIRAIVDKSLIETYTMWKQRHAKVGR